MLMIPQEPGGPWPLIVYCHGSASGIPSTALPCLTELCRQGYALVAPGFRGQPLFSGRPAPRSQGRIEDLDGEVRDVLSAAVAARRHSGVRPGPFALVGHSFGAGAALLAAADAGAECACAVSCSAWFVNPFRFYWDRLRGGPDNWGSWEKYVQQPVSRQLAGLMQRSVTHRASRIRPPLLLFVGQRDAAVYHDSHADLVSRLERAGSAFRYEVVADAGHMFVLAHGSEPERRAFAAQTEFLREHFPPAPASPEPPTTGGGVP
jgi:dipeptidyl aminopeptidase/acylaminoacyl peptidase